MPYMYTWAQVVAVKSLKSEVIGNSQDELNAFLTEVALMRKLKHKWVDLKFFCVVCECGWGGLSVS